MIQIILITFQKSLNAVDRMNRRLKCTQEKNQLMLTQKKCMNEKITIEKQDENNVIDESKSKNCALEEQIDERPVTVITKKK